MPSSLLNLALLLLFLIGMAASLPTHRSLHKHKRQTYFYPEDLKRYAKTHPGTRVIQGTVARYAPNEWPSWYTRTMFKWNGHSRYSPYHPNDVRYAGYQWNKQRGF